MKILFLDIETSPNIAYVWRLIKYTIPADHIVEAGRTLCWSAKWGNSKELMFSGLNTHSFDEMIYKVWELLNEADAVVHYNGKKFDIPTLNREFAWLGLPPPEPFGHIDLYRVVRQNFNLPSYKLDYVLQYFGLGAKVKHKGMSLWSACMEGDPAAWRHMERYNKGDVKPLEKLYKHLLPWIKTHPNYGLYIDSARPVCTNCGTHKVQKRGVEHTKTASYQRYKCTVCGTNMRGRFTIVAPERRNAILTQA